MQMSVVVQNGKDLVPTRKKQHAAGEREKVRKQFRENFKTTASTKRVEKVMRTMACWLYINMHHF
jgi:hypothetical protein